jgi:hypothetical protein
MRRSARKLPARKFEWRSVDLQWRVYNKKRDHPLATPTMIGLYEGQTEIRKKKANDTMLLPGKSCSRYCYSLLFFTSILQLSVSAPTLAPTNYDPYSQRTNCPPTCRKPADSSSWILYREANQRAGCNRRVLVDLSLYHGVESEALPYPMRSCSVEELDKSQSTSFKIHKGTTATVDEQWQTHDIQITRWHTQVLDANIMSVTSHTATTVTSGLAQMIKSQENGSTSRLFARLGLVIVGLYGGSQIDKEILGGIIQQFAEQEAHHQVAQTSVAVQFCRPEMHGSKIFGMFVDTTGDLNAVKTALGAWNNGTCIGTGRGETEVWPAVSVKIIPGKIISVDDDNNDNIAITDNIIEDARNNEKQIKFDLVRRTNRQNT